jgi:hypothetical protein
MRDGGRKIFKKRLRRKYPVFPVYPDHTLRHRHFLRSGLLEITRTAIPHPDQNSYANTVACYHAAVQALSLGPGPRDRDRQTHLEHAMADVCAQGRTYATRRQV